MLSLQMALDVTLPSAWMTDKELTDNFVKLVVSDRRIAFLLKSKFVHSGP